jgi:hypothetical protein
VVTHGTLSVTVPRPELPAEVVTKTPALAALNIAVYSMVLVGPPLPPPME